MARVCFTSNLQRHVSAAQTAVAGDTLAAVLAAVFAHNPRLRGYVLDEQGALRRHMVIFINGRQAVDRQRLSDPVPPDAEVYVMQALSGG